MTGKWTRSSVGFEAKADLAALRDKLTTAQLAAKHDIHQTMVAGDRGPPVCGSGWLST
jgi:transposase